MCHPAAVTVTKVPQGTDLLGGGQVKKRHPPKSFRRGDAILGLAHTPSQSQNKATSPKTTENRGPRRGGPIFGDVQLDTPP